MKEPPPEARNLPETPRNQFRTPRSHSPQGLPTTATKTKTARNRPPQSSTSASIRKRTSLPRVQSTLTQIDFVTQSTPSNDDQLSYIDEHKRRDDTHDTTERPNVDDESDKESDYLPAPPLRSARISKFRMSEREHDSDERPQKRRSSGFASRDTHRSDGPRKSEAPRASIRPRGGRKSLEKSAGKRDKTLTQMDFVRRYITINDDDDDVNMGYIQPTPQKKGMKDEPTEHTPKLNQPQTTKRPTSTKRNRRALEEELDLSTGEPISQQNEAQQSNPGSEGEGERVSAAPVTPRKLRAREIPSSQTPESPGLAIITSSQFRSATRSPSKRNPLSPTDNSTYPVKEETTEARRVVGDSQDPGGESLPQPTTFNSPGIYNHLIHPDLTTTEEFPSSAPPTESTSQEFPTEEIGDSRNEPTKRERTVIYETDADSEYGDSEDNLNGSSVTPSSKKANRPIGPQDGVQGTEHSAELSKDDSQELPLPVVQSSPGPNDPPSEGPMSDASICYRRMHVATQFPHEPIPMLNTQKMAELFPHGDSTQYTNLEAWRPSLRKQATGPLLQTQSQEGDKESTEMVPESSPIREQERGIDSGDSSFQRPRVPGSVVQVESSQAVDRDPQWQGRVLSRSQLLTSSVMESIPLPNFWMGSQDSVGEPYSLPEG
ncbi:hypothetical protein DTO013E5_6562 [Penicillium roqueforti]|uniref:Genomic scaffold, ProqFM164S03 n=1 Tax=Penicillium roqueforti (strain FM164) TaxID=1365484 RepID=W6QK80_PENRF|nr:uncharacterized protein LCP9604111_6775 [Penicillium roqueforti]CDM34634.1 unnamed protein product [Penicillium roqueforti FM164]KAF9246103.1 hypothetical protein LCP9604111_6775 [Penicillium roqueforti]KAI2742990.1 hypothetical protein DTO012A1_3652 [Penicillium roqueforti]KAI2755596.1 hypothetical protein DTO013F2_1279 [Penicillium roqueforti]KAI2766219.1 hypothetical protein DTO012A8_8568 [Penicillium roqueforti]